MEKCIFQSLITFLIFHHIYRYNNSYNRIDTTQYIRLKSRLNSRKQQLCYNWFSHHTNWLLNRLKTTPFGHKGEARDTQHSKTVRITNALSETVRITHVLRQNGALWQLLLILGWAWIFIALFFFSSIFYKYK